jgi:hypothetical protein
VDQLQWSGDGRALLYATGDLDTVIMVHDIATPGSDLAAGSTELLTIPDPGAAVPGDPARCVSLGSLWGVSPDGSMLTCAANNRTAMARPSPGSREPSCTGGYPARVAFLRFTAASHLAGTDYSVTTPCSARPASAALWWASPDGTEVIGHLIYPGHNDVGLFYHNRYIPLPALDSTAKSMPWDIAFLASRTGGFMSVRLRLGSRPDSAGLPTGTMVAVVCRGPAPPHPPGHARRAHGHHRVAASG